MNVSTSALTPEVARGLAADLAPHLLAMRAVTAGTRYADADPAAGLAVSPATKIFIAGMLDRMSARAGPDGGCGAGRRGAVTSATGSSHQRQDSMAVNTSGLGVLRLLRHEQPVPVMRKCPECGTPIRDRQAARLGFCDRCRDFTGMCGAGRKIVCPDVMTTTSWHMPCTQLGAIGWEITMATEPRRTLLCETHDSQIRSGRIPWVKVAVPLRPAAQQARTRALAIGHS